MTVVEFFAAKFQLWIKRLQCSSYFLYIRGAQKCDKGPNIRYDFQPTNFGNFGEQRGHLILVYFTESFSQKTLNFSPAKNRQRPKRRRRRRRHWSGRLARNFQWAGKSGQVSKVDPAGLADHVLLTAQNRLFTETSWNEQLVSCSFLTVWVQARIQLNHCNYLKLPCALLL